MGFGLKRDYFAQALMLVVFFVATAESKAEIIYSIGSRPSINFSESSDPSKIYAYDNYDLSGIRNIEIASFPMPGHVLFRENFTNNTTDEVAVGHIAYFPLDLIFPSVNFTHVSNNARSTTVSSDDGWSATITDRTPPFSYFLQLVGALPSTHVPLSISGLLADYYVGYIPPGHSVSFAYEFSFSGPESGMSAPILRDFALPVPEPETYAMLLVGLGLIVFSARRKTAVFFS